MLVWAQVAALRWTCLQGLLQNINKDKVLGYAQVADALSDAIFMAACIWYLTESDDRCSAEFYTRSVVCLSQPDSRPAMVCRAEVAKLDEMQALMVKANEIS